MAISFEHAALPAKKKKERERRSPSGTSIYHRA